MNFMDNIAAETALSLDIHGIVYINLSSFPAH